MDNLSFVIFHGQLGRECKFALRAANDMDETLMRIFERSRPLNPEEYQLALDDFWYAMEAFLTATANISKVFWPPRIVRDEARNRRARARGLMLREVLGISEESPLRSRRMRDHFEHFDERLDAWIVSTGSNYPKRLLDSNIITDEVLKHWQPHESLRNFVLEGRVLNFTGDQLSLLPLVEAVKELQARLKGSIAPKTIYPKPRKRKDLAKASNAHANPPRPERDNERA